MRNTRQSWRGLLIFLVSGLLANSYFQSTLAQTLPVTAAGATPGTFDVSATGQATYSIPLWAPPGTNGIEPGLSLTYSSSNRSSGLVGPGWILSGLSQITRCQKTVATDGVAAAVFLTTEDVFCVDGVRLIKDTGTQGQAGSTYRRQIEDYSLTTARGTAGNGPAWFEVRTRDGLIYEYGNTADSRAIPAGSATPYAWSLSKIRDRQGNNLIINYAASSGTLRPSSIQYTQTPSTGMNYPYTIAFAYVSRDADDRPAGYIAGMQFEVGWQLASIDIRYGGASGALLRRYLLTYADSPTTQRSLLAAVQECAGGEGTDCFAPTTITYQGGQPGIAAPATLVGGWEGVKELRVADMNGDGRDDLIYSFADDYYGGDRWQVMFAGPTGFLAPVETGIVIRASDNLGEVLIGDFLGTGGLQLLAPALTTRQWCVYQWNVSYFGGACSNVQVDPAAIGGTGYGNEDAPTYAAADVDADGRTDLVWASTAEGIPYVYVRLSTSTSFSTPSFGVPIPAYPIPDSFAGLYGASYGGEAATLAKQRLDFNGDSREDLILVTAKSTQILINFTARQLISSGGVGLFSTGPTLNDYFGYPQGMQWNDDACTDMRFGAHIYLAACNGSLGQEITAPSGGIQLDWNGDGRTDALYVSGDAWRVRLSQSSGASAELNTGIPASNTFLIPMDYDADGLIDLVSYNATTSNLAVGLNLSAGTPPDMLSSIIDGYGNRFSPTYKPITKSNYTASYSGASASVYPNVAELSPLYVVDQFTATDGTGGTYTEQFHYWSARRNLLGLGFLGFATKRAVDSRTGLYRYEEYIQEFPRTGRMKVERILQSDGTTPIQVVTNTQDQLINTLNENSHITEWQYSYFPYLRQSVLNRYEVGGPLNGVLISTRIVTNSYGLWGALHSQTVKTTEVGTGLNSGAEYTQTTRRTNWVDDTANWCLGRPLQLQQTRQHSLDGGAEITRTLNYDWDTVNCRLTKVVTEPNNPQLAVTTDYGYDGFGNIHSVVITPAAGQGQASRTTTIDWGSDGRFERSVTNPKGQVTSFGWDEANGVRTSATDPNNLTMSAEFDHFNRLERVTRPDGTATDYSLHTCSSTYIYCAAGDIKTFRQVLARDTSNNLIRTDIQSFDSLGRPRYTYRQMLSGAMSGEIATYDSRGLVSAISLPFIQGDPVWYSSVSYDVLGRPTLIERQMSEANTSILRTQFGYQGLSRVETDPMGRSTTTWSSAIGDVLRVEDAASNATNYEYDAFGNLLRVRDAAGNETAMAYNVLGLKTALSDPDMGAWTYSYYPLGELKTQTDAKSQTSTFTYDELSRLLTRVDGDGTTRFTYDTAVHGIGQRATASSPDGYSESYGYDVYGRLSQSQIVADSNTYSYDYAYHPATGLLQDLTYPTSSSGFRFKVRYDYQYGFMQKASNYTGDVLGEVYWEGVATDARGQYVDELYANGLQTISSYDRIAGWMDNRTTGAGGGTSIQNLSYQWNAAGNLTERRDLRAGVIENFYYDSLDRLDYSMLNGTTNLDLSYDAIGNITSKSDVGTYTYHPTKKHAVVSTAGVAGNTFTYDANGNMQTRNGQSITWYASNLPKKISSSASLSREFWYGPDNARWKQVSINGSLTGTTLYIGGLVERLITPNVNEFRHYVYAANGVVAVYKRPASGINPTMTYLTKDHLGSLDVASNPGGVQLANAGFSAFGERVGTSGMGAPSSSDLTAIRNATASGFTFHEHLDDLGVIHMNGRAYDPKIGRFLSADPFVQMPLNGQSLNRYSYVWNNPLRYTDPSGYGLWDSIGGWFGNIGNLFGWVALIRDLTGHGDADNRGSDCLNLEGVRCGYLPGSQEDNSGVTPLPRTWPSPDNPPPPFVRDVVLPAADTSVGGVGKPADAVSAVGRTGAPYRLVVTPFNPAIAAKTGDYSDAISIASRCGPDVYPGVKDISCDGIQQSTAIEDGLTLAVGGVGILRAGRGLSIEGLANEFRLQYKHVPGTRQAARELRVGKSAHLFLNAETVASVEAAIIERGVKTGVIRGTTRYGLQFTNPIGYRIGADGVRIPLYYGELKLSQDGFYHVIPRTGPATP